MAQTWDPDAYARDGAFVHGLAEGVLEWLAAQPGSASSTWAAETAN